MHPPRPLAAVVLACCCCAALLALVAGCGAVTQVPGIAAPGTATPTAISPLVRLHAIRTSAFPANHIVAFDATSSNAARITQLSATIRALKPYPPGTYACPADVGVLYHLTFTRADGTQVAALAKPDGCAWAGITNSVSGTTPNNAIVDWNGFWGLFAATFGVPRSALGWFPPASHGPYAPVNVP
jgi:hypothetical protein